jgi:hypothetical protein
VSWYLNAVPLHDDDRDDGPDWPTRVLDVLSAFRAAGCHGRALFQVSDLDASLGLQDCPDPATCADAGGLHLGEVLLDVAGHPDLAHPLRADAPVEGVWFRNPSGAAALHAVCALTVVAGPVLVCGPMEDEKFVVRPDERAEDLAGEWPW